MPASIIAMDVWKRLVESFRAHPGQPGLVSSQVGVDVSTARKYWHKGTPRAPDERAKPIKFILEEEKEAARARMSELQTRADELAAELESRRRADEREKALRDATDTRMGEARLIRAAKGTAGALFVTLGALTQGAAKLGGRIAQELERRANDSTPMRPQEIQTMVKAVQNIASAIRQATEASKQAMEMERLLLGEPTHIIQTQHVGDVTVDEAERRMAAGLRALQRAKERGLVVEGRIVGADEAPPGDVVPLKAG